MKVVKKIEECERLLLPGDSTEISTMTCHDILETESDDTRINSYHQL